MNSAEALLLRPDAARAYLDEIDNRLGVRYGDVMPAEVADLVVALREGIEEADLGIAPVNEVLADIIFLMDELDEDDYFGTQGWRYLMGEI